MAIPWTHPQTKPDNDCITALTWSPEGKRKRVSQRQRGRGTVEKKRFRAGRQSWGVVRSAAQDKNHWRMSVEALLGSNWIGNR